VGRCLVDEYLAIDKREVLIQATIDQIPTKKKICRDLVGDV
jgi:hypothetical protein